MSVFKVGLLSYGMSGQIFHAPFVNEHSDFELYAVCERSKKHAKDKYQNIISYDSVEALISDSTIDIVVINTPNQTHFDFSKQALINGKHIIVEKPFCLTADEATILFELAESVNKKVFVYQNRRFDTDYLAIKETVKSGKLGSIVEAHFRFDRYRNYIGQKVAKESGELGSGILFDLGPHLIDQAIDLFGLPDQYDLNLSKNRKGSKVDDYAQVTLKYNDGPMVYLTASMLVSDIQPSFIVHGTNGSIIKTRADVQESQLKDGMLPSDSNYAQENEEDAAILTLVDSNGNIKQDNKAAIDSTYMKFYDAVSASLVNNSTFYVDKEHILCQLKIINNQPI